MGVGVGTPRKSERTDERVRALSPVWFRSCSSSRSHAVDLALRILRRHRLALLRRRGVRHHNVVKGILSDGADRECDCWKEWLVSCLRFWLLFLSEGVLEEMERTQENVQTPNANSMIPVPVRMFFTRYGRRARIRAADCR